MPVLILLAIVWAVVLVPPYVRNRSEGRLSTSVHSFRQGLDVLGRTSPGSSLAPVRRSPMVMGSPTQISARPVVGAAPGLPRSRSEVRRRRREVLAGLAAAAGFTLLLALAFGGAFWVLHLLVDLALGGYAYLLVQVRKLASERSTKVRYLAAGSSQPSLVTLHRSASG